MPSASLRSSSAQPSLTRVAAAGFAVTGFRIPSSSGVRTTAGASANASGSVLRTTAVTTSPVTATHSPWRLPSAGFADFDPPFADAAFRCLRLRRRRFGFHPPRINDAGCAVGTYGAPCRGQSVPLGVLLLLDRAYVAPIYAPFPIPVGARLRLSATDIRASRDRDTTGIRPALCRYVPLAPPVHDRHTPGSKGSSSAGRHRSFVTCTVGRERTPGTLSIPSWQSPLSKQADTKSQGRRCRATRTRRHLDSKSTSIRPKKGASP